MAYFLAVDAGGTKTDFVLADEDRVLARVRTGTVKRMRTDARAAIENLESALQGLTRHTGIPLAEIACTCVGTAGETVPLVTDFLRTEIRARVPGQLLLLGDVEIALDAAFPGASGVVIIAGTGSNVAGRGPDGIIERAGGWGPVLADQGAGNRIGQEALRRALLAYDECGSSPLLDALIDFWDLASIDRLVEYANGTPPPDFSRLTPVVARCAEEGDVTANEVLQRQAEDLAYLAQLVLRRIKKRNSEMKPPGLAFTGSVLENVSAMRNALIATVRREFNDLAVAENAVDPVFGALWRARTARGHSAG